MMFSASTWAMDVSVIAGALIAVITACTLGYRLPPVRWLVTSIRQDMADHRRIEIGEVLDARMPAYLAPIMHELTTNNGSSMKDHVMKRFDALEAREDAGDAAREEMTRLLQLEIERVKAVETAIARDLTEAHDRANAVPVGDHGAAADAAMRDQPEGEQP